MIGICVDSNSQLPAVLAERYDIEVVPLTVTVNGVDHLEGVDLTNARFYAAWGEASSPTVSTSQPSPGQFVGAYQRLVQRGATEVLSIHVAASMSGTLNSARLAAQSVDVPVTIVDSGTASFGISCCAWAAAEAIAGGASILEAADVARHRAASIGSTFVVGVPQLADRSGRAEGVGIADAAAGGIPVLSMSGSDITVLETVTTVGAAVAAMLDYVEQWESSDGDPVRVAVGTSDVSSGVLSNRLSEALLGHRRLAEAPVQYMIGPSVGAHTGPGTAGLFVF